MGWAVHHMGAKEQQTLSFPFVLCDHRMWRASPPGLEGLTSGSPSELPVLQVPRPRGESPPDSRAPESSSGEGPIWKFRMSAAVLSWSAGPSHFVRSPWKGCSGLPAVLALSPWPSLSCWAPGRAEPCTQRWSQAAGPPPHPRYPHAHHHHRWAPVPTLGDAAEPALSSWSASGREACSWPFSLSQK